jgi:chromosome segregation ATPase
MSTYLVGRESKKIDNKKNSAIAAQEEIKIKKEDVSLSIMIQESWEKLNKNVFSRLDYLEKANKDLTDKYDEILLRNGVLEEKAEAYEKKYETLKKDYVKLKVDYDKVHKESKQLREEIDILKNNVL